MPNTHITRCDDPKYLPFARSRLDALRMAGIEFASQSFDVGGVTVRVSKKGDQEYISISGDMGRIWIRLRVVEQVTDPHGVTALFMDDALPLYFTDPYAYMCAVDVTAKSVCAIYCLSEKTPEKASSARRIHAGSTSTRYYRKLKATDGPNFHYSETATIPSEEFGDVSGMFPYDRKVLLWRNGRSAYSTVYIPWGEGNGYFYTDVNSEETRTTKFVIGQLTHRISDEYKFTSSRRSDGTVGGVTVTFGFGPFGTYEGTRADMSAPMVYSYSKAAPLMRCAAGYSPGYVPFSSHIPLRGQPTLTVSPEYPVSPLARPLAERDADSPEYTYDEIGELTQGPDFIYIKNGGSAPAGLYDRRMAPLHMPNTHGACLDRIERFVFAPAVAASGDTAGRPWGFVRCLNSWRDGEGVDALVGGVLALGELPKLPVEIAQVVNSISSMSPSNETTTFYRQSGLSYLTVEFLVDQKTLEPTASGAP